MKKSLLALFAFLCFSSLALAAPPRTGQTLIDDDPAVEIGSPVGRVSLTLVNTSTTVTAYCGPLGIDATDGMPLLPVSSFTFNESNAAFFAVPAATTTIVCLTASGSTTIGFWETVR
jgi:hypothetical protein